MTVRPVDPRQPVLVGVAQRTQRSTTVADAAEPLELMIDAVDGAAHDAAARRLIDDLDLIVVVRGAWNYSDPGSLVADRLGASHVRTALTGEGGNAPQAAINEICRRIADGSLDTAVVVGGEGIYTRRKAREAGVQRAVTRQPDGEPAEVWGDLASMSTPNEEAAGFTAPVHYYALFENCIRAARCESHDEHRDRIATLLAGFSAVASENPLSWSGERRTWRDLRDPGPDNPMVAYPYTKLMCSNWFTDQTAAVLLCSADRAARAGVPRDRWVFPHAGADGNDTRSVSNRASLAASPAIRFGGTALLDHAGVTIADIAHIDLYSCFASAIQVAVSELDLDGQRPLTVTGGMAYFGGPLANYVTHSVATMAATLRQTPGDLGLVTANGGYLTKHALGLYSGTPPTRPYRAINVQAAIDALPTVPTVAASDAGRVRVEATTVAFAGGEPVRLLAACRSGSSARCWATSQDADSLQAAMAVELAGTPATVSAEGELRLRT